MLRLVLLAMQALLSMPARAMLSFLPCGVVPLVLPFDTSACDALVFAVRCRATRACVRDAAVSLLCVSVHKACYDAGFARAGACGEKQLWIGAGRHCVCETGGGARREAHVAGDRRVAGTVCVRRAGARGEKHVGGGASTWAGTACVCVSGGREAHGWWGIDMGGRGRGDKLTCASAYIVRPLNSWPSRGA